MKYSEFERRIEKELGLNVQDFPGALQVDKEVCGLLIVLARVHKDDAYQMVIFSNDIDNESLRKELLSICYELAVTPLENREEEKKYQIKHKYIETNTNYLNYSVDGFHFNTNTECFGHKVVFTKSKLKSLAEPVFYRTLLNEDIYVWEAVE